MTLIIPNAFEEELLDLLIDVTALGGGWNLRLFTNDVTAGLTPDQVDQLDASDFTEASFTGYSAQNVTNTGWSFVQGNPTTATGPTKTFTRSSTGTAQNIYGYYFTAVSDGDLAWFEQFPGPISIEFEDDAIAITPRLTLDDTRGNAVEPGTITMTGRSSAPTGWLLCQGQAVSRSTYADLFAAIGTAYGNGDGSTTFNLPDLQQRFPLGKAASGTGASLGDTGGAIDHVHDLQNTSAHAKISWSGTAGWQVRQNVPSYTSNITHTVSGSAVDSTSRTFGAQLGGDTDSSNPPFQVVNYMIKF